MFDTKKFAEIYRESIILLVEALEALAPNDFNRNTGEQNLVNYYETIFRKAGYEEKHFRLSVVNSRDDIIAYELCRGLCDKLKFYFYASGCTYACTEDIIESLNSWWQDNHNMHSGVDVYPVSHETMGPLTAYNLRILWATEADTGNSEATIDYCANRYELVRCTADYFRQLLAQHGTSL